LTQRLRTLMASFRLRRGHAVAPTVNQAYPARLDQGLADGEVVLRPVTSDRVGFGLIDIRAQAEVPGARRTRHTEVRLAPSSN
jgi:hypothetical protein